MAKMILGKLGFGKDDFYYGLELCLHKAGRVAYEVTPETVRGCDVLLVTLFWWRDVYLLEAFLRAAGIRKGSGKPIIIAGGMETTMTPEIVAKMVDYVFVGDADDYLGDILNQIEQGERPVSPYLFSDGEPTPKPAECMPTAFAMEKGGARNVVRIEIARGCRFKCAFCALTGLKSYREVPFADLEPLMAKYSGRPVSLFAPERVLHSEWKRIQEAIEYYRLKDHGQDVRLEGLHKIKTASATFGLEGISYRLRKAQSKPWKKEYVLERIGKFVNSRQGIAYLSCYFIADLPGESDEDWEEIWDLFESIEREEWSRRLTLKPVLNPLSPKPFTPLAGTIVHPFRDYETKWRNLLRRGGNSQWGFRLVETLVWGPFERIMDAIVTYGGADGYEIVKRLPTRYLTGKPPKSDNRRLAYELLAQAKRFGLTPERLRIDLSETWPASPPTSPSPFIVLPNNPQQALHVH